jgi:hypothetical protein
LRRKEYCIPFHLVGLGIIGDMDTTELAQARTVPLRSIDQLAQKQGSNAAAGR